MLGRKNINFDQEQDTLGPYFAYLGIAVVAAAPESHCSDVGAVVAADEEIVGVGEIAESRILQSVVVTVVVEREATSDFVVRKHRDYLVVQCDLHPATCQEIYPSGQVSVPAEA